MMDAGQFVVPRMRSPRPCAPNHAIQSNYRLPGPSYSAPTRPNRRLRSTFLFDSAARLENAVTHSKQSTAVISTRQYKWGPCTRLNCISNRTSRRLETGVSHSKQRGGTRSNRTKMGGVNDPDQALFPSTSEGDRLPMAPTPRRHPCKLPPPAAPPGSSGCLRRSST